MGSENNDNFALVPRPPSEIEKAEPGTKRVLSSMVSDTLALAGRQQVTKPVVSVAICGWDYGGLHCELIGLLIERDLAMRSRLELKGFAWTTDLIEAARQSRFDLFILLLNPGVYSRKETAQRRLGREVNWDDHGDEINAYEFISSLKQEFGRPIFVISNEMQYSLSQKSTTKFKEAGADAIFSMPFTSDEFLSVLHRCLKIPATQTGADNAPSRRIRPPRIVMVNDEPVIHQIFETVIRSHFEGVTMLVFNHGAAALEELLHAEPDLLITDDKMPTMSGEELCRRLLAIQATFPIIVDSAWEPTEQWVQEFAGEGLNVSFLPIPCDAESILKAVETALQIPARLAP